MNAQPQMDFAIISLLVVGLIGIVSVLAIVGLVLTKKWWLLLILSGMGVIVVPIVLIFASLFLVKTTRVQMEFSESRAVQREMLSRDQQIGVIPREAFDEISHSGVTIEGKVTRDSSAKTADATATGTNESLAEGPGIDSTELTEVDTSETDTTEEESAEEPISKIIPRGRPSWVDRGYYEENGGQYVSVSSGPYDRESDCKRFLAEEIDKVVNDMIDESIGISFASKKFRLDKQYLEDNIIIDTYKEKLQLEIGPMNQWHAHLQFNDQFDVDMAAFWNDVQRTNRLYAVAAIFGSVLLVLGFAYGILKTHQATDGKYPGRLQFVTIVAILGFVAGGVLLTLRLGMG
ncbi:MAG: hypothetical protein COA78_01785 [Blastopirellula sp.]|nr:MAG: hypothetical protein COA78_01785 [Blastopirellula sp.]